MRKTICRSGWAAGVLAAGLVTASTAEAGVAAVRQEARVESVVGTGDLVGALNGGAAIVENDRDEASAVDPPFNNFDQFTDASFTDPNDATDTQTAAAVQASRLDFAGAFQRSFGHVEATSTSDDGVAFGRSSHDLLFDVTDNGVSYSLVFALTGPNGVQAGLPDRGFVRLSTADGGGSDATLFEDVVAGDDFPGSGSPFFISDEGELDAGRYRLEFSLIALAPGEGGERINYDLEFNTTDRDDTGGGGGGQPIPLPPAAWAAAGTFACYGASRLVGRLRRRA